MKDRIVWLMIMTICLAAAAQAGVSYSTPPGGWTYIFNCDSDILADNWYEDNSQWDGSEIGAGKPGGVSYLTEGATAYMRVQDTGDPRDYGESDPSNRKMSFYHEMNNDGVSDAVGDTLLETGVTFSFRARLSTTGILDPRNNNGGGGVTGWLDSPYELGDGHEIHNSGNSNFCIHQALPVHSSDDDGSLLGFTLTSVPDPDRTHPVAGLHMNSLNGTTSSGSVDSNEGTANYSTAFDTTQWHEFWITIVADGVIGQHTVTVWMDGELVNNEVFNVTGGWNDTSGEKPAFIQIGSTNTNDSMAFDLDFIAYYVGAIPPVPNDPNYNPGPIVNAGPDQGVYTADLPLQLAGTASDDGPENPAAPVGYPGGIVSASWSQASGPGTATFTAATPASGDPIADVLNSTVTFSAVGDYELMLQVSDIEPKDANDIVVIRVRDGGGSLVGHWPLDDSAVDASTNSNDGTFAMNYGGYPHYDTDAAIGTHSIALADPNTNDPNAPHIDLGAATELDLGASHWTISGWIKTTQQKGSGDLGKGAIFANGADATPGHRYCLISNESNNGRTTLVTDADSNGGKYTTSDDGADNDGFWHFIVGVREWKEIRIYRDGVLEGTNSGLPWEYDLSGTSSWNSRIGAIAHAGNGSIYKGFDGLIDDVRVHDYALSEAEILALTAMGPIVANVDAGADFSINWKSSSPAVPLDGSIIDNGAPDAGGLILWTTTAGPDDGLGGFQEATFTNADDPLSTVTFPIDGVYSLTLSVFDPDAVDPLVPGSGYVADTVQVTVVAPTCADVILDGLLLANDFDGDCYVGLSDFVVILTNYLKCNDPLDEDCPWPF